MALLGMAQRVCEQQEVERLELLDPFKVYTDAQLLRQYRFDRRGIEFLADLVRDDMTNSSTCGAPSMPLHVKVTLFKFAFKLMPGSDVLP